MATTHTVTMTDIQRNLRSIMASILRGDHAEITAYGKVETVLVPVDWYRAAADALVHTNAGERSA